MNLLAVAVAGRGLVDPGEPVFGAGDDALLRGRAVFETLRVYGGRPFLFDGHLQRLRASSARMRLPAPDLLACYDLAELVVDAAGETELALRFYWTGETLVATCGAIDPELEQLRTRGLRLAVVRSSRGAHARAKSMSYAENMSAQNDAIELGADDALLVGDEGIVLEAPTANIWWRTGDRIFTPSLELPILAGVTRSLLLALSPLPVDEGAFPLGHLLAADEAFLTSSIREVMPVHAIGEKQFPIGPSVVALQTALRERARGQFSAVSDAGSIRSPETRTQLRRAVDMLCEPHLQIELELDFVDTLLVVIDELERFGTDLVGDLLTDESELLAFEELVASIQKLLAVVDLYGPFSEVLATGALWDSCVAKARELQGLLRASV